METSVQVQQEMRCNTCAKTFDNRKSQLRHASYCRKAKTRVRSRKKACTVCTKAKARCDSTYPYCSRCVAKKLECGYETSAVPQSTASLARRPSNQSSDQISSTISATNPPQSSTQLISRAAYSPASSGVVSHGVGLEDIENSGIDWWNLGPLNPTENITLPHDPTTENTSTNYIQHFDSTAEFTESFRPTTGHFSSQEEMQPFTSGSNDEVDSPKSWECHASTYHLEFEQLFTVAPKVFSPRKAPSCKLSLSHNYVLCTLRSYPHRMLSPSPPPFLHLSHHHRGFAAGYLATSQAKPAPLEVCTAIVQMCSVKSKENTPFIWKTIRMEQQRFLAEYMNYNDQDTVAALQAIAIYFLLRIAEDDEQATNFDIPLIDTMLKLSVKLSQARVMDYDHPRVGIPTWEDWILAESLRRTIIILCLIDFLFDIASAMQPYECDGSLLAGLALPCGRDMWRASIRAEWEKEYVAERASGRKRLTYGDLLKFHVRADGTLDHWLSQLDDFGTLVMAAGSL